MASSPTPAPEPTPEQRREMLRKLLERKARKARTHPLSLGQEALWFIDRLDPGRPTYGFYPALRLRGPLDVGVLERSIGEVLRRHDILRSTFPEVDDVPVQRVAPFVPCRLPVTDLSGLPEAEREAELRRITGERPPLDLQNGPVVRTGLLRLGEEDHCLLLHIHHIVFDGWSLGVLGRELLALYPAFLAGRPSPLLAPPIQYADFAVWQRRLMQSEELERLRDHWRTRLADLPPLDLATDYPRPAVRTSHGDTLPIAFPADLSRAVLDFSRRERVTSFMTLLAAFEELLHRYSGQEDFAVGTPTANRRQKSVEPLIGYFINVLVLRADLHGDPSFRELVQRVRATSLEAFEHQDLTLDKITEAVQPERDLSRHPLFQVMFVLQNMPRPSLDLPGMEVTPVGTIEHTRSAKFELTMPLMMTPEGQFEGDLNFNTDLFSPETARRMVAHYQMVLRDALAEPDRPLSQLPLLGEPERLTVTREWNAASAELPEVVGVECLFAAHAVRAPQAEAVVDGARRWTYGELDREANRLARCLQGHGVVPEATVGICLERSAEFVLAVLAVLKAGGAYVPLDPTYSRDAGERLRFMVEDAGVSVIVTDAAHAATCPPVNALVLLDRDAEAIADESPDAVPSAATGQSLAYVVYTSGSTGRPKGVMVTRANLLNAYVGWEQSYGLDGPAATHLQMASVGFDVFSGDLARALGSGGRLVLCPRDILLSAPELLGLIRREGVEIAEFVPIVLRNLVEHLEESDQRLDGLRVVVVGSDAWYVEDHRRTLAVIGPETRLVNSYGLTEATIDSSFFEGDVTALSETGIVPIGRPFANVRLYVLDPHGRPVPIGIPGELFIGGRGVARGYVNRPDLEAERFVADPFARDSGVRLCRTGDRVRWRADGQIEFLGRVDQQVKIRGFRIEPGEVEEVLREHALLANAAVVAVERTPGDMHLVAYVAGGDGVPPAVAELRRFLAGRLPDYMVPSAFVVLDALPTTASGKVDRRALPAPDWRHLADAAKGRSPQTETERMLAAVWADVLGVERVGAEDNFFELGGNSLLAVRVVARLRSDSSLNLPLAVLFTSPTLEGLASRIDEFLAAGLASHLPAIPVASREAPIPLSFAQERFWFVHQLAAGAPILNMHSVLPISGALDLGAFRETVRDVVQRHESLRTTFVGTSDGRAVQVVAPSVQIEVPLEDASELPERERAELVSRRSLEQAAEPFELSAGPLFRLRLVRWAENEHVLLVTTTHLIFDGWSLQVLVGEVAEIYDARHAGEAAILPRLPVQYADYAVWQRQYLQGETMEALLEFWRATLADLAVLPLPTDRPRRVGAQGEKRWHPFRISRALAARVSRLCASEGVTTYMLTLAAFQLLLHRLCDADDIVVATPVANRRQAETHGMIGLFVNTVVMRGDLSGNPTFRELLGRVRAMALDAFAHQELPFERLVEDLQPERDVTRHPLAQVLFNFLQRHASGRISGRHELSVSARESEGEDVPGLFDLTLSLAEEEHELRAALQYDTRLFDAATAERIAGQFVALLGQVVSQPDLELSRFDLLREDERRMLVEDWNRTEAEFPEEVCAHELFEAQVRRTPDAVAAVCGSRRMVYGELNEAANRLAHRLRRLGVRPDEIVAMWVKRSLDIPVAVLGILKSGGAFLPLDPELPPERVQYMLRDAGVRFLVVQAGGDPGWRRDLAEIAPVPVFESGAEGGDGLDPAPVATPTNLAYAIYTSGSTGRPKGVAVEHRSLVNVVTSFCRSYELGPPDRVLHNTSISFDVAINEILPAVSSGAAVVVSDLPDRRDLLGLTQLVRERAVTILAAAPTALARLNELPDPLPGVRLVLSGGEALSLSDVDRLRQQAVVVNGYGPTETTICATCHVLPAEGAATDETLPIGRPLANYKAYILDQRLQCVPVGCPGELCLGGVGLARGYLGDPELTAAKFVPNPFVPGERIYRTGDRARWRPDGTIEFLGRLDRQVKIRGYRIELGEVEASLLAHPSVREAAVIDWQVAPGDTRLVAYVVLVGDNAGTEGVRSALAARLPEYMVPAAIVRMDALPLASTGKIDRRALPEPDFSHDATATEYVAPRNEQERKLCALWAETLQVERVGVHDDFFALGGHSLLAVRLVAAMGHTLGFPVPLSALFQSPTVSALLAQADTLRLAGGGGELPAIARASREAPIPLSFAQERFWFVHRLAPGVPVLNLHAAVPVSGELDVAAFRQAVQDLVRRHDALRTTFVETAEGQAVQVVASSLDVDLPVEDLSGLSEEARRERVSELSHQQARAPFELSRGPLFRLRLLRCGEDEHMLLVTSTHMVFDAWAVQVLVREMAEAYEARLEGRIPLLPPLPVQYPDYAVWQREYLRGEVLESLLDYWRGQLADMPTLELPTDHPRRAGAPGGSRWHSFRLPAALASRIASVCASEGTTTYMAMLAVFQLLLQRYCGSDDVPVATPVANRRQPETHRMVGLFVNTIIMRGDLSGNPTFRELLRRVRQTALDAFAHQELPFERLVEDLQPERDLSRHPLAQVLFNLLQRPEENRGEPSSHRLGVGQPEAGLETLPGLFDVCLTVVDEGEDGCSASLQYAVGLFELGTIERMARHFRNLLEEVATHPDREIERLDLLDEDERRVLLEDWNRTEAGFPHNLCAHELFEAQARRAPAAVAVVSAAGEMSYAELNRQANRLARRLRRAGVVPDEVVAFCLARSPAIPVAVLGILKAGGAYLPLDPDLPTDRLRYMAQGARARFLVTHDAVDASWAGDGGPTVIRLEAEEGDGDGSDLPPAAAPTNLAFVIYTSGSTGYPKGVLLEHRGLVNNVTAMASVCRLGPEDRVLQNATISFDMATQDIFMAFASGAALVLADLPDRRDLIGLTRLVRDRGVTMLTATPTAVARLNEAPDPLPGVRLVICGGEALAVGDVDRIMDHAVVINGYGPSEASISSTCYVLPEATTAAAGPPPIGKPLANYKTYVLDRSLRPVPVGCPGELCIGGAGLARGYLNDPGKTDAKFVPNPFVPGERIYRSGDRVRWRADGNIEFLGRIDRQVKIRGYRIELGEVEAALLDCPGVREATVVDWEAAPGDKRLVAYVALAAGGGEPLAAVRALLAARLPSYMVPAAFVEMDALPVTATGKVDRKALPPPDLSAQSSISEYAPPVTPLEEKLCALWAEMLKVEKVGVNDDFFALGGHSLLAVHMVGAANRLLQTSVSLVDLFQAPTVGMLAARLSSAARLSGAVSSFALDTVPGCRSLVCLVDGGDAPPLFMVPAIGGLVLNFLPLAARFAGERRVYALQGLGLTRDGEALDSYHEMAALCVEEIQTVQPHGPYRIAGWSMGGMIAVEVARQLHALGEEVLPVGVLDSFLNEGNPLARLARGDRVIRWVAPLLDLPEDEVVSLAIREEWGALAARIGLPPDSGPGQVRRLSDACKAYYRAMARLKPIPYRHPVALLLTHARSKPGRRWHRRFPRLVTERIAGDHYSMLREPHVATVVEQLRRHLDMPCGNRREGQEDAALP